MSEAEKNKGGVQDGGRQQVARFGFLPLESGSSEMGGGKSVECFVGNEGFISISFGWGGLSQSVIVSVTVGNKSQGETAVSRGNPKS